LALGTTKGKHPHTIAGMALRNEKANNGVRSKRPMFKARDLINTHLYPVLATFVVVYGTIQITPIANQARHYNTCVE
jgi:hypothetical protein